jgi:serine phosphatase RsbU (regulator of sigma subunit)/anti-sigma regulatory factor (Ser/Thr protein kinase)
VTSALERFRAEYASAFRSYLVAAGETGLESAYELGRGAVTGELSLLDLAGIHHAVLAECLAEASGPDEIERISTAGTDFFLESLSTFEMTQRGFREARETALLQQRHAEQLRGLAEAALAVNSTLSVEEMLALVEDRARELTGADRSRVVMRTADEVPAPARGSLAVPLIDRGGRNLGLIELADKHEGEFTDDDRSILVQLAQMTSVAIENARLYEHERGIAVTLQRNLLPERLPEIPGVAAAARYLAGGDGVEVGGDWYEVIPLSGERVGIAIGDVVGRGVRAASIMGQLRIALRAYALEFDSPSVVARRLARFVQTLDAEQMTTCVYAVLEPESGSLSFTNAGHPPPLVLGPDGSATYLDGTRAMPLGVVAEPAYEDCSASFERGATVLLYTDGLVEERGEPIDGGLERLRAAVADAPPHPEQLCDRILGALVRGTPGDDVALLAVRALPLVTEPLDLTLPAEPSALGPLRRTLRGWLRAIEAGPEDSRDIVLATVEAVANSVEHAYGPGNAVLRVEAELAEGEVLVRVSDFGSWRPQRDPDRGRGLGVMREAMDAVEVTTREEGTTVRLRRRLRGGPGSG